MSWKNTKFGSSLMSLFGDVPDNRTESCTETVREAMLTVLNGTPHSDTLAQLVRRVRSAPHIQALWYQRSDVMTVLASQLGESVARERLSTITALFRGLLPKDQTSRASPLSQR